jgi:hypothetical protein
VMKMPYKLECLPFTCYCICKNVTWVDYTHSQILDKAENSCHEQTL